MNMHYVKRNVCETLKIFRIEMRFSKERSVYLYQASTPLLLQSLFKGFTAERLSYTFKMFVCPYLAFLMLNNGNPVWWSGIANHISWRVDEQAKRRTPRPRRTSHASLVDIIIIYIWFVSERVLQLGSTWSRPVQSVGPVVERASCAGALLSRSESSCGRRTRTPCLVSCLIAPAAGLDNGDGVRNEACAANKTIINIFERTGCDIYSYFHIFY